MESDSTAVMWPQLAQFPVVFRFSLLIVQLGILKWEKKWLESN